MGSSRRGNDSLGAGAGWEGGPRGKGRVQRRARWKGGRPGPLPGSVLGAQRTAAPCGSSSVPRSVHSAGAQRVPAALLLCGTHADLRGPPGACPRGSVCLGGAGDPAGPAAPSDVESRLPVEVGGHTLSSWQGRPPQCPRSFWVEMILRCLSIAHVRVGVCVCVSLLSSKHLPLGSSPLTLSPSDSHSPTPFLCVWGSVSQARGSLTWVSPSRQGAQVLNAVCPRGRLSESSSELLQTRGGGHVAGRGAEG